VKFFIGLCILTDAYFLPITRDQAHGHVTQENRWMLFIHKLLMLPVFVTLKIVVDVHPFGCQTP